MALTFPSAYADKLKSLSIQENWLVQLGYDEAWDAATSLLNEDIDTTETGWAVDDGSEFSEGDTIKVDDEIVVITAIVSNNLTVIRAQHGTDASEHANNEQIYFNNFLGISRSTYNMSGKQYYGIIKDAGEIEEQLDVVNSKASIGSVTLSCINNLKSGTLSEVLFGGSVKYLNRKVKIYSSLGDETDLSTCALLFEGLLVGISHQAGDVILEIEQNEPWDFIKIPQTKSGGIYEPIAYGDFAELANNTFVSPTANVSFYPVPRLTRFGSKLWYMLSHAETGNAELHYFDEGLNVFHKLTTVDANSTSYDGINMTGVDLSMERSYSARPIVEESTNEFTDPENSFDGDGFTYAVKQNTSPISGVDEFFRLKVNMPEQDYGKLTSFEIHANITNVIDSYTNPSPGTLSDIIGAKLLAYWSAGEQLSVASHTADASVGGAGSYSDTDFNESFLSDYQSNDYKLPEYIGVRGRWNSNNGYTITGSVRVYDIWIEATVELDFDTGNAGSVEAGNKVIKDLYILWVGADGLDQSFSGGSGIAELPHEIHRDLLARFTNLDEADAQMSGFTDLDTARSGWDCRWWLLEQRELKEILEQIQYEGCFIFIQTGDADGSGNPGGKYIYVKNTYSSGDVQHTLTEDDYEGEPDIYLTSIKDIITYSEYNYKKHPAKEDEYISNVSYTNSTERTNYKIQSNENKEFIDLDFLVANKVYDSGSHTDPNDCLALYYDNIKGSIKIMVALEVINPSVWDLERGDIVQVNDSRTDPYGLAWTDLYFMVVEKRRTIQKMFILLREVFQT